MDPKTKVAAAVAAGMIALASPQLMQFLGKWEGNGQNIVYPDKLSKGLPTVCKGITKYTSPYPVVLGDYWSDDRCREVEQMVVSKDQLSLADCLTNPDVTQGVFDALSSHGHNFGVPNTCASRAVGLINADRIADGCRALAHDRNGKPVWSYIKQPDGSFKFVRGLYNRRLDEVKLCLSDLP
jgi:GH24 family phage-related lysozyme (muramidase)